MVFSNFNPPFTNANIEDFFDFESSEKGNLNLLRNFIKSEFPSLEEGLKYHVPFYSYNNKPIFFLHYLKTDKKNEFDSEISFLKGDKMFDNYGLFQSKNSKFKAILIPKKIDTKFLSILKKDYIEQSISLII